MDTNIWLPVYGRRFYIPAMGRWLTPDPAGFTDSMNLYAFVLNDPLTKLDLYGLIVYDPDGWKQYSWQTTIWDRQSPIGVRASYSHNFSRSWSPSLKNSFVNNRSSVFPSLNPDSSSSPHFYVNGIQNSAYDNFSGAANMHKTFWFQSIRKPSIQ